MVLRTRATMARNGATSRTGVKVDIKPVWPVSFLIAFLRVIRVLLVAGCR